jgi:hypothetical protein
LSPQLVDGGGDGVQVLLGVIVRESLARNTVVLALFFVQFVWVTRIFPQVSLRFGLRVEVFAEQELPLLLCESYA